MSLFRCDNPMCSCYGKPFANGPCCPFCGEGGDRVEINPPGVGISRFEYLTAADLRLADVITRIEALEKRVETLEKAANGSDWWDKYDGRPYP